mgnify:CR=1 FL=1
MKQFLHKKLYKLTLSLMTRLVKPNVLSNSTNLVKIKLSDTKKNKTMADNVLSKNVCARFYD